MGAVNAPSYVTVDYSTMTGITMNPTTAADNGVWTASLPADPTSVTGISTGYDIYQWLSSDSYGAEAATVTGSVYSYQATGLTNGIMYYFAIQSVNPRGESDLSNEVSATPMTVPSAPTEVRAVGGNGQATITFTAPVDQGGSPITGYEVKVLPDNRLVTGHSSP